MQLGFAPASHQSPAIRLLQIWADRYRPDATLSLSPLQSFAPELTEASTWEGRIDTAKKLKRLSSFYSHLGWLRANELLSDLPNVDNLAEIRFLAPFLSQVYGQIGQVYQAEQPPIPLRSLAVVESSGSSMVLAPYQTNIRYLAAEFAFVIDQLKQQLYLPQHPHLIGFATTQFHFSSLELRKRLTPAEDYLLMPYFKFVEEQISMPWQQVCALAAQHEVASPTVMAVGQFLVNSQDIAETVYRQLVRNYPDQHSRRGMLSDRGIRLSVVRDLNMFQVYLAECVLEDSMIAIEQKLLPFCHLVFPRVQMSWAFVRQGMEALVAEVHRRLDADGLTRVQPYTQQLLDLFAL